MSTVDHRACDLLRLLSNINSLDFLYILGKRVKNCYNCRDMRRKEEIAAAEGQPGAPSPASRTEGTGTVIDLEHTLNRLKVWMLLGRTNPEVANLLLNRDNVEAAAEALSMKDSAHKQRKEALKALGLHEQAEREVVDNKLPMEEVLGFGRGRGGENKRRFEAMWEVEIGGYKKTVEEWLEYYKTHTAEARQENVEQLRNAIERVKDGFGIERLKFVSLDAEKLSEVEDGIAGLKAKKDFYLATEQKETSGGKTAVAVNFAEEVVKEDGVLQVRDASKGPNNLGEVVKRVREAAATTQEMDELAKLSEADLMGRFKDVNQLLVHIQALRGSELSYGETKRLKHILISLQTQYQEQLANKIADQWIKDNKSDDWQEVKYQAVEKAINKRRGWFSARVDLEGSNEKENYENLLKEASNQARVAAEKLQKAPYRTGQQKPYPDITGVSDANGRSLVKAAQLEDELQEIMGESRYNMFDDKDFWNDLQAGDEGVRRIAERARDQGVVDQTRFENMIHQLKKKIEGGGGKRARYGMPGGSEMDDIPEIITDLHKYMTLGEWGAAANAMLEYTTRVGMQENTNDLQFMYVRRNFMEKISKVSPDFAEQFGRNQQMGYLPGVFAQKPEDFYGVQGKVFAKGNTDLFFGPNAFMSGNVVEMPDGKKMVISTKSFVAALRSERNILRILRAEPNTMDSTLQNILLEEMFGEGTKLGVVDGPNGEDLMTVTFADGTTKLMSEIKIKMQFAEVGKRGYKGWRPALDEEIDLEKMLNRNQWMLRNGLNFMWYSEMWMDTMKSYQKDVMGNAPKALVTAASAIADYKASFENVAPPFLDLVQKIGDMLGPMERYKAADMVGKNVADRLTDALIAGDGDEAGRKDKRERYEKVGKLFEKIFVRKTKASLNGTQVDLNNRIRSREMARYAFNDFAETGAETVGIVRKRLIDLGMFPADVPSESELIKMYQDWKIANAAGIGESQNNAWNKLFDQTGLRKEDKEAWIGKQNYMGQEYAAVWEELTELKMSGERALWSSLSADEFKVLATINNEVTGGFGTELTKDTFFGRFDIEAFMDRTGTKHGDDWEQFAMKYAPAKLEAMKLVYKIAGLNGTAEDYDKLKQQLDLFMTPEEKRTILLALMDRQSIATRGEWLAPYEVAEIERNEHGEHKNRSSFEIKWVKYTDSTGKTFFARTADGTRAYHKTQFRGNYARKVLDKDWWRPHDFEVLLEKWRGDGLLDKHTAHHMAEKLLGTKRSVDYLVDNAAKGMGIDPKNLKGFKEFLTKGTTTLKLWAIKLFLFDDPKYALWTLFEEFMGFGGKSFEHITGVAMGGGKHR